MTKDFEDESQGNMIHGHDELHSVIESERIVHCCTNHVEYQKTHTCKTQSNCPEVFLGKGVLNICSKLTGEHPCRSVISIKLQSNLIEVTLQNGCSSVNLLYIFRTPFPKNTPGRLLLKSL